MTELLDLKIFDRIVQAGSLSAAGREMHISPTVISKRLTRLEKQLGAKLLHRTTRKLTLTDVGRGYHNRVALALTAVEEAECYVSGSCAPRGVLRVSAPTAFGRLHVAPFLGRFMELHPDVELKVDLSDDLVDVVAGGFDLVIRVAWPEDSTLVARRLAPCRRMFCASPGYIQRFGEPVTLEALDSQRIVASSAQTEWLLDGPGGPVVYRPRSVLHTNSAEVVREAVVSGMGIGLHSTWNISAELRAGTLRQILPQYTGSARIAVYAIYPGRRLVPPKVRAFIEFLSALYSPEPYWDRNGGTT
jgi:DNA-binding transcriptional LysR family regulator